MSDTRSPAGIDFGATLRLYRDERPGVRMFTLARRLLAPLGAIVSQVPPGGAILDVGCGHGLVSLTLGRAFPQRRVVGVDPSAAKLDVAARVGRPFSNVEFRQGSAEAAGAEQFGTILILDVLYLLPYEQKLALLRACRQRLAPGGVLLLKTNDTHPAWKYRVARAQERLMTGSGLTLGTGELHFLSCHQNADLLRVAGFDPEVHHLSHWTPYPHVLFVAQ